jgi:hypothetical protein
MNMFPMNKDFLEPKNRPEPIPDNWMEEELNRFYNGAVENCIQIVSNNYINGHTVVNGVLDNVINQLKGMKK